MSFNDDYLFIIILLPRESDKSTIRRMNESRLVEELLLFPRFHLIFASDFINVLLVRFHQDASEDNYCEASYPSMQQQG